MSEPNTVAKGIKCADCLGLDFSITHKMNPIPEQITEER